MEQILHAIITPKFSERWLSLNMHMSGRINKKNFAKYIEIHKKLGINMVYNVGHGGKVQSSSDLVKKAKINKKKK